MKETEVEELTEAFKAVKTQMASELEANVKTKGRLETDLTETKHSLLDVKHQLSLAEKVNDMRNYYFSFGPAIILLSVTFYYHIQHFFVIKELEKKFSQTGAYKNLKKMLAQKNEQIKELRAKLKEQQMEEGADAEEEE